MRFLEVISGWINRHFSNEEAIYLVVLLVAVFVLLFTLGGVLAPVLIGLVFAFLLQGMVKKLVDFKVPEKVAVYGAFIVFVSATIGLVLFLVPLVWRQSRALIVGLPGGIIQVQAVLRDLSVSTPGSFFTPDQVDQWLGALTTEAANFSGTLLNTLLTQVPSVVALLLYMVIVPFSVFFFLKDRNQLIEWFLSLLPSERPLLTEVGDEMNVQLANYVRGKFIEILIVGLTTFVTFTLFGLNYAALLAVLVGLSVLIPFIGAAVVTIPVALVAIVQFGWTLPLTGVLGAYLVIQFLDGNFLVPLLFSSALNLHPITIVSAVLAFGGLWGIWGVLFAIPLATLVKAIYNAWPKQEDPGGDVVEAR
ncbi:MAG: AI-2E family transporter [Gammaproteobacteria bacterium]|nr:AI-2E family transporter [Gammaproteobacteria bacterium]